MLVIPCMIKKKETSLYFCLLPFEGALFTSSNSALKPDYSDQSNWGRPGREGEKGEAPGFLPRAMGGEGLAKSRAPAELLLPPNSSGHRPVHGGQAVTPPLTTASEKAVIA